PTTFTFPTKGVPDGTYNNPGLVVATGPARSTSGWSDVFGGDTILTFGAWTVDDPAGCIANPMTTLAGAQVYCDNQVGKVLQQAGVFMHELGHELGLFHGGTYYKDPTTSKVLSVPTTELNCKSNVQTVMNYLFTSRGLPVPGGIYTVDYSRQKLLSLNEGDG